MASWASCGSVADGCGGTLQCGGCGGGQTCGGGGTSNVCGAPGATCVAKTCAQLNASCGAVADGCGHSLQCGTCSAGQTCGGGGAPNVCGGTAACVPRSCAQLGANRGAASDGCGETLQCGSCSNGETCGGGGTANVCGIATDGGVTRWFKDDASVYPFTGIAGDASGNVIGVTAAGSEPPASTEVRTTKYDRQGNLVWAKGDPFNSTQHWTDFNGITAAPNGSFVSQSGGKGTTGRRERW